jgi:hypothetical protein
LYFQLPYDHGHDGPRKANPQYFIHSRHTDSVLHEAINRQYNLLHDGIYIYFPCIREICRFVHPRKVIFPEGIAVGKYDYFDGEQIERKFFFIIYYMTVYIICFIVYDLLVLPNITGGALVAQ